MNPRLFGCSISISDDILVVGSPIVGECGCIYTYNVSKHDYDEKTCCLSAHNGHNDDGFGISCKVHSVSSSETSLIVGSHRKTDQGMIIGAAYIYSFCDGNWKFVCQLSPSIKSHKSFFGCAVDINDNVAVVGAYGDNTHGWRVGSTSIFTKNGVNEWVFQTCLYPNISPTANPKCSYFGFSVSLSDTFLAIGAPSENNNGSVYLYDAKKNWSVDTSFRRIDGNCRFGFSVSVYQDQLVVGTPGENGKVGKASLYNISAFYDLELGFIPASRSKDELYCETIRTKSKSSRTLFGRSVALYDNFVIVSGFGKTSEEEFVGSAFLYLKNNLSNTNELEPVACIRDKDATELFGHDVDLTENYVVVGDPTSDTVHVYITNNLIGCNLKKWAGSCYHITPPEKYALEIH